MNLFISAGEPSGDLHGSNLVHSLKNCTPDIQLWGFGGTRMADAGCQIIFPLVDLAVVGFSQVFKNLPKFFGLIAQAEDHFKKHRPDALVLIDYPGFHWWLAAAAKKMGIPVVYFVPPQIWAWGSWRVRKMKRLINLVLCNFPFEEKWFSKNGLNTKLIGHPYYDEILRQKLDAGFLDQQKQQPGIPIGLLPGSRNQEVERNGPSLIRAAQIAHKKHPETRFLIAAFAEKHQNRLREMLADADIPAEIFVGKTQEIIHSAYACASVSGSVSLEIMAAQKPTTIMYKASRINTFLAHRLKNVPYITLVNLLAAEELFPESFGPDCPSNWIAEHLSRWISQPAEREKLVSKLAMLKEKEMTGGACELGAKNIIEWVLASQTRAKVA